MGGLSETTLEKMKIEKEREMHYDQILYKIARHIDNTLLIKLYEQIRTYKEKIFNLKYQAEDINKLYNKLSIPDFKEYALILFTKNNITEEEIPKIVKGDFSRITYIIFTYYESMIRNLEQALIEEKAEKDCKQKEVDEDKEDVFELE